MDRFDPFVKYADVYGDIINWEKDPMNKPQNQNKYFFSDGKTYYEQICKMLRLMSVFKEAFNQIYSNEDEISEAWENFVNNLSASVVEGSEPDVTLTWTDDSVNFEFTMVPGVPGEQGVGITSISFNSDYTMTITLSDGNTYTSMSLKGETGPQGPQGETGSGLQILDVYATLADLQSAHPTGQPGDAYQVGSGGNYILYIWSSSQSAWVQAGTLGTVSPYTSLPLMDGTASAGSQNLYARGDHVHPSDTSRASKAELDALIKTSQALIDQSFTYRESPAIQDGLARIDKIKGNTLVWNQLYSPAVLSGDTSGVTRTQTADGLLTLNGTANATGVQVLSNVDFPVISGHKYLVKTSKALGYQCLQLFNVDDNSSAQAFGNQNTIYSATASFTARIRLIVLANQTYSNISCYINIFDLTKMGLDSITDPSEFSSLFPLSYYDYSAGSLLSFNGTGLKTIGFNQWDEVWEHGSIGSSGENTGNSSSPEIRSKNYIPVLPNTAYFLKTPAVTLIHYYGSADLNNYLGNRYLSGNSIIIPPAGTNYVRFRTIGTYGDYKNDICLNINDPSRNGEYEPYTESNLSLPVSQYFPNGMRSAGNVYDEITSNKGVTRMGAITFDGTQNPVINTVTSTQCRAFYNVSDLLPVTRDSQVIEQDLISNYLPCNSNYNTNLGAEGIHRRIGGQTEICVSLGINRGITTWDEFKAYLSAHPLTVYYPLAVPTETAVDLDLDFMTYEDGTEQLLPVNGSVPSTSPIIADMTYLSIDDAMEYVLEKLANVPQNTQQILESLEDDVSDLQTDVGNLQTNVSGLQTSVGNINTNIGQLSSTVAGHTASISGMQSDISDLNTGLNDLNTGLNDLEDTVTNNTSRIGTLETGLTNTDSQVDAIDARVLNLETDLLIVVKKEYDYDSVAGNTNFGVQTGLSQEPGYKIIGIVGSEVQQGEYTSAEPWIIVTQAHVHYTSTGGVVLSMMARNVSEYTKTNVRVYLYLLCIKDTQSQ